MELRTMKYFLAVAREENMTRAAQQLHVTQPTLSKQMKALEEELGKKLFLRHSFSIQLTEEGVLLRKRAEDLVRMADKITAEFHTLDDVSGGDIYLGLAESYAVLVQEPDPAKYHFLPFPEADVWGVVMPADCPLAEKEGIEAADLAGLPLFCSEQGWNHDLPRWCGSRMEELYLEGSFRLSYNGSLFVREGLGYLLTFRHLIDTTPGSGLVFRPLKPKLEAGLYLIWKKYQVFTPIAERFLAMLRAEFGEQQDAPLQTP